MRQPAYEHVQSYYLLKTEPDDYSFDDLERDGSTVWDGVRNYAALKHMREVRKGDLALVYHTGKERRVVGVARAASDAYPDPRADDPKIVAFDLEPVEHLERAVPLSEIKDDPDLQTFDLVRLPRLSAMAVTPEQWEKIAGMGRARD